MTRFRRSVTLLAMTTVLVATLVSVAARSAAAAAPVQLNLNVLLIGTGSSDPTTAAWQSALSSEGVAYTVATAAGTTYGTETVALPALTTGSVGNFNGVVFADSPAAFAAGQLSALDTYESTYRVRQIDGYTYPIPAQGITAVTGAGTTLDNTTATLTAAGLAGLPGLKGTVPFDTGTYGVPASVVAGTIGAAFTPWLENAAGQVLAGVYQHPGISTAPDPQAGVSELSLTFDYNPTQLQWLLLAPGLINWVTQDTHLGLYRNAVGACTAPTTAAASSANCTGSVTDNGTTYTDPGQVVDTTAPNDQGLVNALLADKADFNWITHTWSHEFLGCVVWQPQAVNSVTANASGGSFTAGGYSYEVTAATAYGESEPSLPKSVTVGAGGSVTLSWPDATNGTGTDGTKGPTLAQEEANHTGGSGFWGYNVYRENPGTTTYGLVGQVAENPEGRRSGVLPV